MSIETAVLALVAVAAMWLAVRWRVRSRLDAFERSMRELANDYREGRVE